MVRSSMSALLVGSLLLSACSSQKKAASQKNVASMENQFPAFDSEAHRGGRGLKPENTIPAMKNAIDIGVTTLEMDANITKDLKVVVSHDQYMNPDISTAPDGTPVTRQQVKDLLLYQMNYADIVKYDVGMRGNPNFPQQEKMKVNKPLLSDLIQAVEKYTQQEGVAPKWYNIETKSSAKYDGVRNPKPEQFVALLMKVVIDNGIVDRTVIQSFDKRTLQVLHKKFPAVKTSFLIGDNNKKSLDENIKDLGFTPFILSPDYKLVTPALVKACHDKGVKIVPWTVNDKAKIQELKDMGVDGIISDYPNYFKELGM
ncbi:glycerophosphodiester phosphodiesterase [Chitinophaga caeni]|uniref:Glycerophosphodiester phosphodiesterase n=2 Tax=Chitinophaga caeni TaxID=2029983 RepID=A0A291R127_9BACT|nr:glycerophosphodiester phosphodiesterase [Chitinophaga caeni]